MFLIMKIPLRTVAFTGVCTGESVSSTETKTKVFQPQAFSEWRRDINSVLIVSFWILLRKLFRSALVFHESGRAAPLLSPISRKHPSDVTLSHDWNLCKNCTNQADCVCGECVQLKVSADQSSSNMTPICKMQQKESPGVQYRSQDCQNTYLSKSCPSHSQAGRPGENYPIYMASVSHVVNHAHEG